MRFLLRMACLLLAILGPSLGVNASPFYYPNSYKNGFAGCSSHWFAKGEVLCWDTRDNRFPFVQFRPFNPPINPATVAEKRAALGLDWKLGCRLGVGYRDPCDRIYVAAYWTHYKNKDSRQFISNPGVFARIEAPFPDFIPTDVSSFNSTAGWKLDYNIADLEIGVPVCITRRFVLSPFIGVRATAIQQKYNNLLNFITLADPGSEETFTRRGINHFRGAGVRAGFDMQSLLWCGINFYGKIAGSAVYGKFTIQDDVLELSRQISTGIVLFEEQLDFPNNNVRLRANLEAAFGLQWSACLFQSTKRLTIKLGYEFVSWYRQNQLITHLDKTKRRSAGLEIQGLQLGARFDF